MILKITYLLLALAIHQALYAKNLLKITYVLLPLYLLTTLVSTLE